MDETRKRRFWQLHFGTVLLLWIATVVLLLLWGIRENGTDTNFATFAFSPLCFLGGTFELLLRRIDQSKGVHELKPWLRFHLGNLLILVVSAGLLLILDMDVSLRRGTGFWEDSVQLVIGVINLLTLMAIALLLEWGNGDKPVESEEGRQ